MDNIKSVKEMECEVKMAIYPSQVTGVGGFLGKTKCLIAFHEKRNMLTECATVKSWNFFNFSL